jgi:hypothetical protein
MKRAPVVAIASLSAFAGFAAPHPASAAYYYEATTTVEGGQGEEGQSRVSAVHAWVDGQNARIEFEQSEVSGMFPAGSHLLTNDGGQTLYLVNPAKKTISELNLGEIFRTVGNISQATGGVLKMEFGDFTSEKVSEEPGQPILGHDTTRYRFKSGYTMTFGVLGFTRKDQVENDQEFDCTDDLDAAGFEVWLRPDRLRTGNEDIDKLIAQEYSNVHCLPLRNRTVTTMTGQGGRESTTTTTTEVTALRTADAPAGAFQLPSDYETVPLTPSMPDANEEGESQSTQQDAPKRPRFRDLFGH